MYYGAVTRSGHLIEVSKDKKHILTVAKDASSDASDAWGVSTLVACGLQEIRSMTKNAYSIAEIKEMEV